MIIMPRVKIDYVVSFSDEDPENQANNLLSWEVSKKRWLCRAGEPSCSVVLQLARAVKISSLQIGVHHAALVEVLVGRSETPNEPYQVLVPRSVFLTPREARGAPTDRVRSFSGSGMGAAATQRWDRLRLVCSQPYNKHCQYGISFIHVFEPEGEAPAAPATPATAPAPVSAPAPTSAPAVPSRMFSLETFSSDEEEFSPGELFAKHRRSGGDTGAQIRQATSKALNNNSEAATKLVKTSLSKHKPSPAPSSPSPASPGPPAASQRDKDDLLYTKDDEQPHAKIDHIVQRHRDEKSKDESKTPKPKERGKYTNTDKTPHSKREEPTSGKHSENRRDKVDQKKEQNDRRQVEVNGKQTDGASGSKTKDDSRKRPHSDKNSTEDDGNALGPVCSQPLAGVVLVLSGYQNPRRARLRDLAASLGAQARAHWGPGCTHLICAFSNTPKLSSVRSSPGGGAVPAPTAEWIEQCARRGRRLPWRWFACEPARRLPADLPPDHDESEADADTDDEIEKVLRQNKKARASPPSPPPPAPPSPPPRRGGDDSDDVEFVKDERMQGSVTVDSDSCDTDVDDGEGRRGGGAGAGGTLPALFAGMRFIIRAAAPLDASLLARYARAYGGLVVQPEEAEEDAECLLLCGGEGEGSRVRADWVWACHAAAALLPVQNYLIT